MSKQPAQPAGGKAAEHRFSFLDSIRLLLLAFPQASTAEKIAILAMALFAVMFIGLGLVGSVTLPGWAVVTMFVVAAVLIFTTNGMVFYVAQRRAVPFQCRHIPIYPPDADARAEIRSALEEIRSDAASHIRESRPELGDDRIRGNIFLLAQVQGGPSDGLWKLVINQDFAINMNHPPELQLQFNTGQGATGISFRDGLFQLTRRQSSAKGPWDRRFQMTKELEAQVHKNLKWIISFPLLKPDTSWAIGVLSIDGLEDVPEDQMLYDVAGGLQSKVNVVAQRLSLLPSICVGIDKLGVMTHA
jgi:hypothetical protein